MEFDIIQITPEELKELSVVSMKMLRTAQQKKDEIVRKHEQEMKTFKRIALTNGMINSSLLEAKKAELKAELDLQSAIIADNLLYNMSLNEPTDGGDVGGGDGSTESGYIVDYTLPYSERYKLVRDYYFTIEDPQERLALYTVDEVAKQYLSSYYRTLFDVLYSYSK